MRELNVFELMLMTYQAVVAMKDADDELDADILQSTAAFFFFGVPHQGMATKFLVPIVKDQPNRALLETLSVNSPLLGRQMRDFPRAFGTNEPKVISFYETKESPTAELVSGSVPDNVIPSANIFPPGRQ